MEQASAQILRSLRRNRSQVAWARKLGYRANPVTDWECGRSFPTAEEALRVAVRAGVAVEQVFTEFDQNVPLVVRTDGSFDVSTWLQRLCAGKRIATIAYELGSSRSSVSRWLSGDAKPRLPDFLRLVDAATGRVHDLVATLVPIEQVPALRVRHEAAIAAKRLAFDAPWTEAILRLLETRAYQSVDHDHEQWLAKGLDLPLQTCRQGLEQLSRAGLVELQGTRFVARQTLSVDTRGGKQALRALKTHWAQVAAERAPNPSADDVFGYNVMSVSENDLARIRDLLGTTYREIRAIVAASEPSERVALLNLHLVCW
jgi:transcriptional regulator with XRE-family HTH domain